MQVDPKLHRLQTLIEQKRSQQTVRSDAKVVGQAGNPRFAAAAARVREARLNGGANQPGSQVSAPLTTSAQVQRNQTVREAFSVRAPQANGSSLLTETSTDRTLQLGETAPTRISPPHLGRNFDSYA